MTEAKLAFCISVAIVLYTYIGYPLLLWVRARILPQPWCSAPIQPTISVIMAVRNEEQSLLRKIANLATLRYPRHLLEFIIVSDGSTDTTNDILTHQQLLPLSPILLPTSQGKACAINAALRTAVGDILVFFDARQRVDRNALHALSEAFADQRVGCVSGELMLENPEGATVGLGLYWEIEKAVRRWEAQASSLPGATGAIYAVRRSLVADLPPGTLLDDVYIPMRVIQQGYRAVFTSHAVAWDRVDADPRREFRRKVRTLTGVYQLVRLLPWTITPANPIWLEFVSHKVLRLIVPFALVAALVCPLAVGDSLFRAIFVSQCLFYVMAVAGMFGAAHRFGKAFRVAGTFLLLNLAALIAFRNAVFGKRDVWA